MITGAACKKYFLGMTHRQRSINCPIAYPERTQAIYGLGLPFVPSIRSPIAAKLKSDTLLHLERPVAPNCNACFGREKIRQLYLG